MEKLKCKKCGNDKLFYRHGYLDGRYTEYLNEYGSCDGVDNGDLHDNVNYYPKKEIYCAKCDNLVKADNENEKAW